MQLMPKLSDPSEVKMPLKIATRGCYLWKYGIGKTCPSKLAQSNWKLQTAGLCGFGLVVLYLHLLGI